MDDSAKVSFDDGVMEEIALADVDTDVSSEVQESVDSSQVEKFNTSNEDEIREKLSRLYDEFTTVEIDEERLKEVTQSRASERAVSQVSFRTGLYLTSAILVTALLLFMVIYNFIVINGLNGSIKLLETDIANVQSQLSVAESTYADLTNEDIIRQELTNLGYSEVSDSDIFTLANTIQKVKVVDVQGETNWFDSLCNYISSVFYG